MCPKWRIRRFGDRSVQRSLSYGVGVGVGFGLWHRDEGR